MFKNYMKTALRNITRNKVFSIINISGLAIGLTGTLLILMYVINELSYEHFHKNRNRIYRVAVDWGKDDSKMRFAGAMDALGPALREQIPEVESAVRLQWEPGTNLKFQDKTFKEDRFLFVEKEIFDIFTFPLIQGNKDEVLSEPFSLVISEEIAYKYFGSENPVGKTLLYQDKYPLNITGIMETIPVNTHLKCDFLVSYQSLEPMGKTVSDPWQRVGMVFTYILLKEQTTPEHLIEKMDALLLKNTSDYYSGIIDFKLQRLPDIYMNSDAIVDLGPRGNKTYVIVFSTIAGLLFLIACFNFMNLSTAQSLKRIREVGMRKVLGANRKQLFKQFVGESMIIAAIAILVALILFELFSPMLNRFLDNSLEISRQNIGLLFFLIPGLILFVGFLAGSYPALILSKSQPIETLSEQKTPGSSRSLFRKSLVILQFAMAILLIVGTLTVFKQLKYMKNTELGFNKENVVLFKFHIRKEEAQSKYTALKNQLLQHPGIVSFSGAYTVPGINSKETKTVQVKDTKPEATTTFQTIAVDYGYLETMGLELLKGRDFSLTRTTDETEGILLNQEAARKLDLNDPLGTRLYIPMKGGRREVEVIGVIRDFHITSLENKIEPLLLYINPAYYYRIAVRIQPGQESEILAYIKDLWQPLFPESPFEYQYLKDAYNGLYVAEEKIGQLLTLFTILSIFVACLGLLGLVLFMTERRRKEIGIRKVAGATEGKVVICLVSHFARWVLVANLFAWPAAWWVLNQWLQGYAYRINLSIWMFLSAALLTFFIAVFTVGIQALRAARANPVKALRYE